MLIAAVIVHLLAAVLSAGHLLLQEKRPEALVAWMLALFLLPVLGVLLYVAFGTDRLQLRRIRRRERYDPLGKAAFRPRRIIAPDEAVGERWAGTLRAMARLSGAPPTPGNRVELLNDAEEFYPAYREAVRSAREQFWTSFYVWRDDAIGRDFVREVADAAARGVDVRVLVDEVGSGTTPDELFDPIIEAGGRFSWATTLFPRRNRWFVNLRNHRKITVVDGETAFVGGMNIGCEYVDGVDGQPWHDMQVRIAGPAVTQLGAVFADDWHFATSERIELVARAAPHPDGVPCQMISGGPEDPSSVVGDSIAALINGAQREIVLTTPYFVPDTTLVSSLCLAAARGVRVRLLVSAETDMGPLLLLSRSYFDRLLAAGVEIHEYPEDIHHAKCILVDDELAMIGSVNLDERSFHLNYEVAVVLRDRDLHDRLGAILERRLVGCDPLDAEAFARRPVGQRLREGAFRLLAPLI